MASIQSCSAAAVSRVSDGWECMRTAAGAVTSPSELPAAADWIPADVPGTFAAALRVAGLWNLEAPLELDQFDVWYRCQFRGGGDETLVFEGLATIADVWLNGETLLRSENMFLPQQVDVRTRGNNELVICFRSLDAWLQQRKGRARWRTRLATPATLRFARTTLLGHMPGWCPTVHPVGPWRPVLRRQRLLQFDIASVDARMSVVDGSGRLALHCILAGDVPDDIEAVAEVGGTFARLGRVGRHEFAGDVVIADIPLWWPHTHGEPRLHQATLRVGEAICDLGRIGFRRINIDRGDDGRGFAIRVNGETVFCRGACWTTPDIVSLPCDTASYRPWLEAMRDAGMNMVRIGGTMVYEAHAFYALCDELGLLVWQDAMLANFDYPTSDEFRASLNRELDDLLRRTQTNASLAVFCGGSEVLQQAAMLGLPPDRIDETLYRCVIPEVVQRVRPDLAYVANSPSGGELPFLPDVGLAHYYGVGAYLRPLDDARRSGVRFAPECLALANVPCNRTAEELGVASITDPAWKRAVPRDPGAPWDFEDVRDHYLGTLFAVDPQRLRYEDFARYLDLSRAVSCLLMEQVFGEWRRVGSSCHGGLVWQLQDLLPGAGWGVIDSRGRPKPAWYGLKRAFRPRHLIITDEGLNGLAFHILNEADTPLEATLRVVCLKDGRMPVREAEQVVRIAPRGKQCLSSAAVLPGFFDITYAYRFGPRVHDVTVATLNDAGSGELIADAWHFPAGASPDPRDIGLEVTVEHTEHTWWLRLQTQRLAQFVHIEDAAFTACENWLHLPPGQPRRIALRATGGRDAVPEGEVHALNMDRVARYQGRT